MITVRDYESNQDLTMYIDKGHPMIIRKRQIRSMSGKRLTDMEPLTTILKKWRSIRRRQYELEYRIEGKRDNEKKADRLSAESVL